MLVLDEKLPADQQQLLRKWPVRFRCVGVEIAAFGNDDENLIPHLHRLPRPTFFSLDRDFFRRDWTHAQYCLVWLNVEDDHAAEFICRFLRHPEFDTQARRMGAVARVHDGGVTFRRVGMRSSQSAAWRT